VESALYVNRSEVQSLTLGIMLADGPATVGDLYGKAIVTKSGKPSGVLTRDYYRDLIERIGGGAIVHRPDESKAREYLLTEEGKRTAVLAGHLMDYSARTNVSVGEVMGSYRPTTAKRNGSFRTRLSIFGAVTAVPEGEWVKATDIYDQLEAIGTNRNVAITHLTDLVTKGLMQRTTNVHPTGGTEHSYSLVPEEGATQDKVEDLPTTPLGLFVRIVKRYTTMHRDPDFIEEGVAHAERFASTPSLKAYMVFRTYKDVPLKNSQKLADSIRGNGVTSHHYERPLGSSALRDL
jgi:hypothetical protein